MLGKKLFIGIYDPANKISPNNADLITNGSLASNSTGWGTHSNYTLT